MISASVVVGARTQAFVGKDVEVESSIVFAGARDSTYRNDVLLASHPFDYRTGDPGSSLEV